MTIYFDLVSLTKTSMEQKDYLMREIEKIGAMMRAILSRLLKIKDDVSITSNMYFKQTNELMNNEIRFDLEKFLTLDREASLDYIEEFIGFSSENIGLLAEVLYQFGINEQSYKNRLFLEKAIQLYEFCSYFDKTFSIARENRISEIRSLL
jgi:hypothetical protein